MRKKYVTLIFAVVSILSFATASAQVPAMYLGSQNGYYILEGNNYAFTVNLYSAAVTPVTVTVTTSFGDTDSNDFTSLSTTVTIPAGQISSGNLSVATTNDSAIEPNENFLITFTVTSGNTANTTVQQAITITDNDKMPEVSVSASSVVEGSSGYVHVYLGNPYSSAIAITCTASAGTASTSDFSLIPVTLVIPSGQTAASFVFSTTNDAVTESNETFTVTATVTSGNTSNVTATDDAAIIDNDTLPTLIMNSDQSFYENGNATFYFDFSNPYNAPVTIQFATAPGTAGSADFTAISNAVTVGAGATYGSISVPITNDLIDEPNEMFTLTATSASIANSPRTITATIIDNDGKPDFKIKTPTGGTLEGSDVQLSLELTHASTTPVVIEVTAVTGTAGSSDYTPITTTVTIPAGSHSLYPYLAIPTILDTLEEPSESFTVNAVVTSGNTYNTSSTAVATIIDNYNVNAINDSVSSVVDVGTTFQLLANDTLHGLPLNSSDVTLTLESNNIGATVNALSILTVPATAPLGYYQLNYTVCETANPAICDTALIILEVRVPLEITYNTVYADYNGDGYTSAGDVINYVFTVSNIGIHPISNIEVANMWNINVLGGPIATLDPGQSDTTTFYTVHILTQDDINFGYFGGQLELSFKGIYNGEEIVKGAQYQGDFSLAVSDGIRLTAFADTNANGTQEAGEPDFPLGHFNYEINNSGVVHNLYSTPFYLYESNPATSYKLSYTVDSEYAAYNTCAISYPDVTVAPGSGITTYNFPVTVTPHEDLSVSLFSYNPPPRPGFTYQNYVAFKNNTNHTVASGTLTFTKGSAVTVLSAPAGSVATATGFTYDFTDLLPYESRYVAIGMQVPTIPTVALGDLITNTVAITALPDEINNANNTDSLTQTIVGSYDPNDKTESHGGKIVHAAFSANDYLTYTIRFENTGTANAVNIRVTDVLDSKLDETSIRMVDASAGYALERIGNTLTWNFFGIDLPPSVENTTTGHGFVTFSIKPKPGYQLGDMIPNAASIYFDFNPAIVTNTFQTIFVTTLDIKDFAETQFIAYPNPVKDRIVISSKSDAGSIDSIIVSDMSGKTVLAKTIHSMTAGVDVSHLSGGLYLMKISSGKNEKTIKFIKE